MSDKTLAKALNKNVAYNGSYFKIIGSTLNQAIYCQQFIFIKKVYEYDKDFYS